MSTAPARRVHPPLQNGAGGDDEDDEREEEEEVGDDEAEEEDEDDEEEPRLKYQRLGGSVPAILSTDAAAAIAVADRMVALGTHNGTLHILGFQGNQVKEITAHTATINDISFDADGEYIGSCSDDGTVAINSLFTDEKLKFEYHRPMKAIALDPNYARNYRRFATGGLAGQVLVLTKKSWGGYHKKVLRDGEGPIHSMKWRADLLAWANDVGVKVHDMRTDKGIAFIERPKGIPRPEFLLPHLVWQDDTVLVIGWGTSVKIAAIRTDLSQGLNGLQRTMTTASSEKYVDIVGSFQTGYHISGIAPFGDLLVVLAYIPDEDEKERTFSTSVTSRQGTAQRPEIHLVSWKNDELTTDALPIHGYEHYKAKDYALAHAPFSGSSNAGGQWAAGDEPLYYIVSPKDIVVAKPRILSAVLRAHVCTRAPNPASSSTTACPTPRQAPATPATTPQGGAAIHTSMAPTGDRASAHGTKGKGSKPKMKSVRRLLDPPPIPASTGTPSQSQTAGSGGSRRLASQSVASSGTCESPATAASVLGSVAASVAPSVDSGAPATTSPCTQVPIDVDNDDQEDDDPDQARLSGKRFKKCTSWVWQYFTKKKDYVEVEGNLVEELWGHCNFARCDTKYRAEGTNGTTSFKHHLKTRHSIVKGQQQLTVGKHPGSEIAHVQPYKYDPEASLKKLNLAITMHEYPLNIVEHEYFVDFIKSLRPSFPIRSRVTVRKEIMDTYLAEKDTLYAHLKTLKCRFSATMDMWTSCQNKGYMCVTIHWIDDNWHIQKRIIGFFNVKGRHTGAKLSQAFTEVMVKWYIESRLFALTLDNASSNEVAVNDMISDLKNNGNGSLVCDGIFFHVRCACHILNLVARDGLKVISGTLSKIRALVLAVKGSPLQWEELMKCASEAGLDTKRGIQMDVSTRWNSTYLMLRDALYYKDAFIRLKSSNRRKYDKLSPSAAEWDNALTIFACLKKFYDVTEILSGTSYPTANLFYRGFCEIKVLLDQWCYDENITIREMAISMNEKFEKYWDQSNIALAVAYFLDPRYKKRGIEYYMKKFHGSYYQAELDEFVSVVKKLYNFYAASSKKTSQGAAPVPRASNITDVLMGDVDHGLEEFLYEASEPGMLESNELEMYMAEPLVKLCSEFDILAWWKNKREQYPILSQIVRDVMAMQVSTVASESAFSAAGRVVDPYRSRLDPEMVQALICTKDWVAAASKDSKKLGSIVSDLEVDALTNVVAKLKIEENNKEGDEENNEEDIEKANDIESDPNIMHDA